MTISDERLDQIRRVPLSIRPDDTIELLDLLAEKDVALEALRRELVDHMEMEDSWYREWDQATDQRDSALAKLAAVEALCEALLEGDDHQTDQATEVIVEIVRRVRVALEGDA